MLLSYIFLVAAAAAADVDIFAKDDMDPESLGLGPGWINIADMDASYYSGECPEEWDKHEANGKYFCQAPSAAPGCYSIYYPVPFGTSYNKTAGYVHGYQKGTTDGFQGSQYYGISGPYVDGVSITLGSPDNRKHIWTYAIGYSKDGSYPNKNCPCSVTPGPDPPSFVGEHYYCHSGGPIYPSSSSYYTNAPLWQGTGCTHSKDNCCANFGMPYFYREFFFNQHESIEVRICSNEGYSQEAVLIDKILLYVK